MRSADRSRNRIPLLLCLVLLLLSFTACGQDEQESSGSRAEPVRKADTLVVYFSATGNTKAVAEKIAGLTGGDLAEIVPAVPYESEDLDYGNDASRASREQNDPDARPEIKEEISLEGYTTLYLGYPIWWGQAPRIMSTFAESHDFTGITVIPFCTSGSSDIGDSDDVLAGQAGSGTWQQGRRFPADVTEQELKDWIGGTEEAALTLAIGDDPVSVAWEENESVSALKELAQKGPVTIAMSPYDTFEQVGSLGTELPRADVNTTTSPGDIVLYQGDQIVIFYGSHTWDYTRLGRITDKTPEDLTELLGNGSVRVTISCE